LGEWILSIILKGGRAEKAEEAEEIKKEEIAD
jgi:hypothetical protein